MEKQKHKKNRTQPSFLMKINQNQNKDLIQQISDELKLENQQVLELRASFERYDVKKENQVEWFEVDDIYRDLGFEITQKIRVLIKKEISKSERRKPDFKLVCEIFKHLQTMLEEEQEDLENIDYINAFSALGGNSGIFQQKIFFFLDKTGFVSKKDIIKTIKEDFQLDFDIEGFLSVLKIQKDELIFSDFCALFESTEEGRTIASLLTDALRSQVNSRETFQVNYQDFERWDRKQNAELKNNQNYISQTNQEFQ